MTDAAAPAVLIRGLTKRYGVTTALSGVDMTLRPGELCGLLGLNGAGKSTLLRTLFGLIRADAGHAEHTGTVAGFIEDPAFYPYLSARANLELLADLDDTPGDAVEALQRVGLAHRAGDRVGGYSTGMRQRLGIAGALLRRPDVLLLDEPTSGLDPAGTRTVTALLRELADAGVAVLVSTHLLHEFQRICDSYVILRSGQVAWHGTAAEVAGPDALESLFFEHAG